MNFNFNEWLAKFVDPDEPESWISVLPHEGGIILTCSCGQCMQAYGEDLEMACAEFARLIEEADRGYFRDPEDGESDVESGGENDGEEWKN